MKPEDAAKLRAPFPESAIEHKNMGNKSFAYINHAVVTDRLIEVDPAWYWQPISVDPNTGMPLLDDCNGLWIRLTICGVSRIGYGASEPHQKGADAIKTAISDAIKNAAMRFGVALDLWGADANVICLTIGEDQFQTHDFSKFGGIPNNAGTGKTGDVLFTTVGAASGDRYTIVLECLKNYG